MKLKVNFKNLSAKNLFNKHISAILGGVLLAVIIFEGYSMYGAISETIRTNNAAADPGLPTSSIDLVGQKKVEAILDGPRGADSTFASDYDIFGQPDLVAGP